MRLLVDISPHGYGHLSQIAPVVNELRRRLPSLELLIRTTVPRKQVASRVEGAFAYLEHAPDFGMEMASALEVRAEASFRRYQALHQDWDAVVAREARAVARLAPDLLLGNVPYLSLAAARAAGVPAVALCSLNWADIFWHYCRGFSGADAIYAQMQEAYRSAELFLQPRPHMPMGWLDNRRSIAPIALRGQCRREELDARFGLEGPERLVLVAMGGMPFTLPTERWPRLPGVHWLFTSGERHPDEVPVSESGMSFADVLASVDVVLTKPGYGTFAEAGACGVDVLYVSRGGWPEEPYLLEWLRAHARVAELGRERLLQGDFTGALTTLAEMPRRRAAVAGGEHEATELIQGLLQKTLNY